MKNIKQIRLGTSLICTLLGASCPSLSAAILYQHDFDGDTTTLHGVAPDTADSLAPEVPNGATWSAGTENTNWTTGGGVPAGNGIAFLPIEDLQTNTQYQMTLTFDYPASGTGWISLGLSSRTEFSQLTANFAGQGEGQGSVIVTPTGGWSFWSGQRTGGTASSDDAAGLTLGNGMIIEMTFTTDSILAAPPVQYDVSITDSVGTVVDVVHPGTGFNNVETYTAFMISTTGTTPAGLQLQSFEVAVVPEPGLYAMLVSALSLGIIVLRRRKR